jgi:hypothetical protein
MMAGPVGLAQHSSVVSDVPTWERPGGLGPSDRIESRSHADHSTISILLFTLNGYRVVKNHGIVGGIVVRSRSVFGADLQNDGSWRYHAVLQSWEETRHHAFDRMHMLLRWDGA